MATYDQRERAKTYLLEHPQATNKDVAASLGVAPRTVGYARAELVNSGLIPPAWGDHKSAKRRMKRRAIVPTDKVVSATEGTPFETQNTTDLNKAVVSALPDLLDEEEEIDIGRLKRILYRIAKMNPDDRIRTQAVWTLTRIQQDMSERPLGPGLPRTKAEIVARLLQLFEAVGAAVVIETMQMFLDKRKGSTHVGESTQAVEHGDAVSPPVAPTGTPDHNVDVRPDGGTGG